MWNVVCRNEMVKVEGNLLLRPVLGFAIFCDKVVCRCFGSILPIGGRGKRFTRGSSKSEFSGIARYGVSNSSTNHLAVRACKK